MLLPPLNVELDTGASISIWIALPLCPPIVSIYELNLSFKVAWVMEPSLVVIVLLIFVSILIPSPPLSGSPNHKFPP